MVVPKKGPRFGQDSSHQKAMMANMAISLFEHGRITTTLPKAKMLRGFVDKLITIAKKDNLAARRNCLRLLGNYKAVQRLFNEVAPGMYERSSGFTRILKYKNRLGDNAQMVIMELVE
ncbi:MAG: 50S ribosomal protein L17 [Actinomycetota bacterium]|nr:50S ribosomal protein L17 [Actinomycetota bacterium]